MVKSMQVADMKTNMVRTLFGLMVLTFAVPCYGANKPVRTSAEEAKVSSSLKVREQAVVAKEKEISRREEALVVLQKDVDAKLAEMLVVQKDISEKLKEIRAEQDLEFKNLIKVYSTMSASKVAPILNQMEDANVAKILRAMKNDLVAKIIPKLEAQKAVRVSRLLGRISASSK